jgi:hypothetical protein
MESNDLKDDLDRKQIALGKTRESIQSVLEQMVYCAKDGRADSLCPCCFGKVQQLLGDALATIDKAW